MSNKYPVFPIPEPQHFSDYGFDLQIDYFQVLDAARRQKKESSWRSTDSLHFKLQKPISKDEQLSRKNNNLKAKNRNKRWWWKNALFFLKWNRSRDGNDLDVELEPKNRARASISGPVYITESRCGSGSTTPFRISSRPSSGPLEIPYLNLRELNMEHQARGSTSAKPIYLVT
ncbi:epoxide hydrolase 2 [Hibiscus syriacus]|uniref:Epoxide hydrolase 2 n=1 Tax=Hibiscus syriacus TaxID=106335 RepID=A0A6A2X0Y7_HIBSY|nr:uncharacterized protein LOC120178407 [Hibiscus syriacus]XP_039050831.1 uncharacterized protein LOC120192050 [Hibiscus syriacus]KAE8668051.1 epoxide hydrolase 2 [Hibiscus syriacus]KAE8728585.1 epoxide hydrolase 2 [Hibiscus syriacus]